MFTVRVVIRMKLMNRQISKIDLKKYRENSIYILDGEARSSLVGNTLYVYLVRSLTCE